MPTLLHLNGPSGVGKTTLARAHAAAHPGTLLCDIDDLRSWVSGWEDDFIGTGEAVRTSALALVTAYLTTGRDVVLPQLIATPAQAERFEAAAAEAGATYVAVMLDLASANGWEVVDATDRTAALASLDQMAGIE